MIRRILSLIRKELIGIWKDPKSRFSLLAPPIIQLVIFTFAATLDVKNVSIGILNRDNGEQGFELVQRFRGAPTFKHIYTLQSVAEIGPFIDEQKGVMVVSIDETFSRSLGAKKVGSVQLILDGRKSNTAQIVSGYASQILQQYNSDFCAKALFAQQNVKAVPRNWFNPNLLYYWYNIPSLFCTLAMLTCLIVTSISVAREREMGTFDQLLVTPLRPIEILIGKIVPGLIVGIVEGTLLWFVGVFLFDVPFVGSFWLLLSALTLFILSISGVGLLVSSLSATQQQAMLGIFVCLVPFILLSGFATPIENMPTWLQPVTYIFPLRYMLVISKGIFLKGMTASIVMNHVWQMALIALCTLTAAWAFFRRRLE